MTATVTEDFVPYERDRSFVAAADPKPYSRNVTNWSWTCSEPKKEIYNVDTSGEHVEDSQVIEMTDWVVPNYHVRRDRGEIFNNPMTRVETRTHRDLRTVDNQHLHRRWETSCTPDKYVYWGSRECGTYPIPMDGGGGLPTAPVIDVQPLIDIAVNKAYANMDLSQAMALATLAESRSAVSSMKQIFFRLFKILKNAKKLNIKALRNELRPKELADRWMELRYAIRPLIFDAKQVCDALNYELEHDRQTFRGYATETETTEETVLESRFAGTYIREWKRTSFQTVEVRSGVLAYIDNLTPLNTWGIDSVIETGWELVPFSFIVDWFFNIGDTIAAWTPEFGLRTLASWYVINTVTTRRLDLVGHYATSEACTWQGTCHDTYLRDGVGSYYVVENRKERVPNPSRAILPRFTLNLNAPKLADLSIIGKKIFRR